MNIQCSRPGLGIGLTGHFPGGPTVLRDFFLPFLEGTEPIRIKDQRGPSLSLRGLLHLPRVSVLSGRVKGEATWRN